MILRSDGSAACKAAPSSPMAPCTKSNSKFVICSPHERSDIWGRAPMARSVSSGYGGLRGRTAQHARRRLHFGEAIGAPLERELVPAPLQHVPILIDVGGRPGFVQRQRAGGESERNEGRSRQRRHCVQGAEGPGI